jgi:hypothetical protein
MVQTGVIRIHKLEPPKQTLFLLHIYGFAGVTKLSMQFLLLLQHFDAILPFVLPFAEMWAKKPNISG